MPTSPTERVRPVLAALCLVALSACAHLDVTGWAGEYAAGPNRLHLRTDGTFAYDGGGCFPADSDSDVGFTDAFEGHYRRDGRWIALQPTGFGHIEGCSSITLRLLPLRIDGRRLLLDEPYVRSIAHDVRRGAAPARIHTWHINGESSDFAAPRIDALPKPYSAWARMPPPAGRVVDVGPTQSRTRYGSGGRIEGEERFATVTLDFGREQGAFPDMPVCVAGVDGRLWLRTVDERTSTLRWTWSPASGGPPPLGLEVASRCR